MNPIVNILTRMVIKSATADLFKPKAAPVTPVPAAPESTPARKTWNRAKLIGAIATVACAGLGVYTGHIDADAALAMLTSIDFTAIFGG